MKTIITILLGFFSVTASASVQFYTISTNATYSANELALECGKDRDSAAAKLAEISARLSPEIPNALTVSAIYGRRAISGGTSRFPSTSYEYFCILDFQSKDPSLVFDDYSAVRITHVGRGNWDTACRPAYDAALANPNSPVAVYWKIWTLIQGRMCEVTTVEVKKK